MEASPETAPSHSTDLVRSLDWEAAKCAFDPEFLKRYYSLQGKIAVVISGEASYQDVFGESSDVESLRQRFEEQAGRQMARRYDLPPHLHWMGDGVHDNYRPSAGRVALSTTSIPFLPELVT